MYYDVRSELILFANALWERVKPDCADIKNGGIVLKLRRLYTNASKHALILQFLKMSFKFGILWETNDMSWATLVLKLDFLLSIVSFDKCQVCVS